MPWTFSWNPLNWMGKRPQTESKDVQEQPKTKRMKLDLDLVRKIGTGIGQARITCLNPGQGYRLSITNYLTTTVKGGELGSITVRGEAVTILDAKNNVVFTGDRGDVITVQDNPNNGTSTAMTIVGAGNGTERCVKITGSNMYATHFQVTRENIQQSARPEQNATRAIVNASTSSSTQKEQDEAASQADKSLPLPSPLVQQVMQMQLNNNNQTRAAPASTPTTIPGIINSNINGHQVFLRKTGSGLLNDTRTFGLPLDTRHPRIYCTCNGSNSRSEDQKDSREEKGFSAVNI